MSIPSKFHGTYTSQVTNWAVPTSNPAGTLVVPATGDDVEYTIGNGSPHTIPAAFNGDNIRFTLGDYTFTATSWNAATSTWSGGVSDPNARNPRETTGTWNANKQMSRREHQKDVA